MPIKNPWGGGNQWLLGFVSYLKGHGYLVNYKLGKKTDCVVIINSKGLVNNSYLIRKANHISFGLKELKKFKLKFPKVPCIQRINDTGIYKGAKIDDMFKKVNELCEHTVFISEWILRYYQKKWWTNNKSYVVINNAADSNIFYPVGTSSWHNKIPFKLVTHHWSSNIQKGFNTYKQLDDLIFDEVIKDTELYIVGNYPKEIKWRSAKIIKPLFGIELADTLRSCHAYITASKFEASGMHWIEGVQCGLPLLYGREGGAIADLGKTYGIPFNNDLPAAIYDMKVNYDRYKDIVMANLPSSQKMYSEYLSIIEKVLKNDPINGSN